MNIRFSGTPASFPLAFIVSPLVGGFATAISFMIGLALLGGSPTRSESFFSLLAQAGGIAALLGFLVCVVYTGVIGGGVAVYHRVTRRVPRGWTAALVSFLGWLPFAVFGAMNLAVGSNDSRRDVAEALLMPFVALVAAFVTGMSFWFLALRRRAPRVT